MRTPGDAPGVDAARLCAVLGHELRNPLAAAMTGLAVVDEMTDEHDPRSEFLLRARDDIARAAVLLEGWLDLARAEHRSKIEFEFLPVVRTVAKRTSVTVDRIGNSLGGKLRGHPALLERALENLVVNAKSAGATQVHLEVRSRDGLVEIDVVDDGPGVPQAMRSEGRLFDPFVSGGTTGGAGLGLAICRDVAASLGGRIELVASGPATGSRFRISVPAAVVSTRGRIGVDADSGRDPAEMEQS